MVCKVQPLEPLKPLEWKWFLKVWQSRCSIFNTLVQEKFLSEGFEWQLTGKELTIWCTERLSVSWLFANYNQILNLKNAMKSVATSNYMLILPQFYRPFLRNIQHALIYIYPIELPVFRIKYADDIWSDLQTGLEPKEECDSSVNLIAVTDENLCGVRPSRPVEIQLREAIKTIFCPIEKGRQTKTRDCNNTEADLQYVFHPSITISPIMHVCIHGLTILIIFAFGIVIYAANYGGYK